MFGVPILFTRQDQRMEQRLRARDDSVIAGSLHTLNDQVGALIPPHTSGSASNEVTSQSLLLANASFVEELRLADTTPSNAA